MPKKFLIVPCYNEALRLPIEDFKHLADKSGAVLVFVDDGSTDNTDAIIGDAVSVLGAGGQKISLENNKGKGEAVRIGMNYALGQGADILGYIDADMSTTSSEICRLLDIIENGEHRVVIGSRVKLLGNAIERSLFRHYLGRIFATIACLVLDGPVYDTQCGAKFFKANQGLRLALERPFCSRWAFDIELLGRLSRTGAGRRKPNWQYFVEIPLLVWKEREGSKLGLFGKVKSLAELFVIWFRLRGGGNAT